MEKKKVVVALGHKALGTTLPEQQVAVKNAAKAIADLVEEGCQVAISHMINFPSLSYSPNVLLIPLLNGIFPPKCCTLLTIAE